VIENSALIGCLIVFLVFFLESIAFVGLIVPGTAFLILIGFLISRNILDWNVMLIVPVAIALGDLISFYFGERGKSLFKDDNLIFKSKYLEKGELFFEKHKNKSIILGRFIGVVRPLMPFIAGLFRVSKKKFVILNSISIILWTAIYFSVGYFFGQAFRLVELWSTRLGLFILFLATFLFLLYLIRKYIISRDGLVFAIIKFLFINFKTIVIKNEFTERIVKKYPWLFLNLRNRFNPNKFSGLPLTLITLVFFYAAFLLGGVTEDVLNTELIIDADLRLANFLKLFRHIVLIKLFFLITALGGWELILIFSVIFSVSVWLWGKRFYIVALWATIIGSLGFNVLGKLIFHRSRPEEGIYIENFFSFPSGHATLAAAFYGFLIYFFWRNLENVKNKINISFACLALIVLIGFSRLYLGVHFFSDVWAGFLLGSLWLIVGISIGEWSYFKAKESMKPKIIFRYEEKVLNYKEKIIISALVLFGLGSYIIFVQSLRPIVFTDAVSAKKEVDNPIDIFKNKRMSKFSENLIGSKQEPLNLIVLAENDEVLADAFRGAGWHLADPTNFRSYLKLTGFFILDKEYPQMPITPSFWNARVNDFGFEKFEEEKRHYARFWKTKFEYSGKDIYVGKVNASEPVKWNIVRKIDRDIDRERGYALDELGDHVGSYSKERLLFSLSEERYFTDGNVYVIFLKK